MKVWELKRYLDNQNIYFVLNNWWIINGKKCEEILNEDVQQLNLIAEKSLAMSR